MFSLKQSSRLFRYCDRLSLAVSTVHCQVPRSYSTFRRVQMRSITAARLFSTEKFGQEQEYINPDNILKSMKELQKSKGKIPCFVSSSLSRKSVVSDYSTDQISMVLSVLEQSKWEEEEDRSGAYSTFLIACCDNRDYVGGYRILIDAEKHGIIKVMPNTAINSVIMMLYKYQQFKKIITLFDILKRNDQQIDHNVVLTVIRSHGNCHNIDQARSIMRSSIKQLPVEETALLIKYYSVGIEVCCQNHDNHTALALLHEMTDKTRHLIAVPRSCFEMLFAHFSVVSNNKDRKEIKILLDEIFHECESTPCNKQEIFNQYIFSMMKSGNIGIARQTTLEASKQYIFNEETYIYLLMGLNFIHTDRQLPPAISEEEEKAQILSLAMTLMHKYRRFGIPKIEFYKEMIILLGSYHEYDKLDIVIQNMNKDKISFDGKIYSALIEAFEDTQLVIDIYNDAKNNLPASDPYAAVLFPQESQIQEYQQFPKIIDCIELNQSACKTIILRELSNMKVDRLDTIHDLILTTDFNNTSKPVYTVVTSLLNSLNLFWFQGSRDGHIYITRDAIIDYLTMTEENKTIWGFKKLVIMRSKPLPIAYEILKGLF